MSEISVVQQQRHTSWYESFSHKAKKIFERIRKAIFLCPVSCVKRGDSLPTPHEVAQPSLPISVGNQTEFPFIIDQLRHGGETMKHRGPLNFNTNANNRTVQVICPSQSSSSLLRGTIISYEMLQS